MPRLPRCTPCVCSALLAAVLLTGCAPAIGPAVEDAQIVMRVRTALVNDPDLGTHPIDVRVAAGVVTLTGVVPSESEARRAVDLVRRVEGVRDVTPALEVGAAPAPPLVAPAEPQESAVARPREGPLRLIGLGVSLTGARTRDTGLGNTIAGGPLLRLPNRSGLTPAVGFSWTEVEVESGPRGDPGLAHLNIRPVMIGLSYNLAHDRGVVSASVVGGYAFNTLAVERNAPGAGRAIAVSGAPVWRPGLSTWYDVSPRVGLNVFLGGLVVRPRVTFASNDEIWSESLRADALLVSVGLAWWLF